MKRTKRILAASMVTSLMSSAIPHSARAQDDLPPPPDFDDSFAPPPPPAAGGSGRFGSPTPALHGGGSAPAETGTLSKAQREKFNKSGIEDVTNQNFPESIESFDFPNAEITDVIRTISELTGKNFIIDPGVRGKITIVAPSKITVAEAYKAFLSALAINGYTVVPSGSFLKVKNARNAQRDSIETYSGAYYPSDDQMITRIIHLKHISAEVVNRELRMLASKDGELNIYTPTNSLIMSDYGSNVDRVMKIINQLDVPGFEEQIEVIRVRNAKSKDLADLIDKIVNKGQKSSGPTAGVPGSFSSGIPRFTRSSGGAQGQSGNSFFMAIPDDRTNSIIVVGNKSGIIRVKKLVSQLDFPVRPDAIGGVYVYYVKHGDAEKIAAVMQGVTKDATPKAGAGAGATPGGFPGFGFGAPTAAAGSENQFFGGDVKVTADKNTNSLVILASKQDYERVLNLLSRIDIARDQVFVEANIMEMTMSDNMSYKIGYYKFGDAGAGKTGFNTFSGDELTSLLSAQGGTGGILGFGQGKTVAITDPVTKTTVNVPNLLGFINFIKQTGHVNVLSNPTITALDNETAVIEVGERVATSISNTSTAAGTSQTANFEDATLKLELKPFISPESQSIRMEIKQSVKQAVTPTGPKSITDNTLALATRSINTSIVVNNGDTAILGGLMKDQETEAVSKVPLLGDLPIIGWLFKSKKTERSKINLLVFLSPKILRTEADRTTVIGKKLDERLDFIKAAGGKDPFGGKVDEIMRSRSAAASNSAGLPAPNSKGGVIPELNRPAAQPNPPPMVVEQIPDSSSNSKPLPQSAKSRNDEELDRALSMPDEPSQNFQPGTNEGVDQPLTE